MIPTREEAIELVRDGLLSNPGPWGKHCLTVAHCAERIACDVLPPLKKWGLPAQEY